MSYFALATHRFEEMVAFYVERLGLTLLSRFERPGARGAFIELGKGVKLEIVDASVQKRPMSLQNSADDRFHVVIETDDIHGLATSRNLPEPEATSWGATVVTLKDPDGVGVWLIEWNRSKSED
jgi:catechol 2,3-dioxygenase-like lactoylglutathione lyase family enzyme